MVSIGTHGIMKIWIALTVVQQLAEERRTGSIEMLLSTPLTFLQIAGGQALALVRQFGWALLIVLLADLWLLSLSLDGAGGDAGELKLAALFHIVSLGFDAVAIVFLGLWRAVVARHSGQAAGSAFFAIVALPCLIALCGGMIVGMTSRMGRIQMGLSPTGVIFLFYALCFFNNLGWMLYAWIRLRTGFREAATAPLERGRNWFAMLLGKG